MKLNSSDNSENFHQTAWRHIPEDSNLHNHHCENIKSPPPPYFFQVSIFEHVVRSNFEMPTLVKKKENSISVPDSSLLGSEAVSTVKGVTIYLLTSRHNIGFQKT